MEGTIKKLNEKFFGFISQEGKNDDLFFHGNDLVDVSFEELKEGNAVTFEVEQSKDGRPKAAKVKLA